MKEKDYIEELIELNLDALNDNEPSEDHFARFEAKLNAQQKSRKITGKFILKIAAAVVFVLLATNQAFIYFSPNQQGLFPKQQSQSAVTLASVSQEYKEVEYYYTTAINTGINHWNALSRDGVISEEEQKVISSELEEFEERFKTIQSDLAANPNDERVINAMLEFYKAKLDVINMIVGKLEEAKTTKETNSNISL